MPRPTLFLDRDGTIIVERHYLCDPEQVTLEAGAAAGLRRFAEAGYRLVVVSNQSGIARGYFDETALAAVTARLDALLRAEAVVIADWLHCPHGPEDACACRKPRPGLLQAAHRRAAVDWTRALIIGDKPGDVEAGRACGIPGILVGTGHGADYRDWAAAERVPMVDTLAAAADLWLGPPRG